MTASTTRRALVAAAGAALVAPALPRFAHAAEFSLRLGHTTPVDHPFHIRVSEAAATIKAESNGKVELQVFPNGQLGGDNDLMSQARSGAIDFCQPTGQILSSILPVTATNALGFVWTGYDQVWPAMDGALGAFIRTQIIAKTGLFPMQRMWDLGFRQVTTSSRAIRTAEDLVGLKLRTPVAPSLVSLFTALNAAPVGLQLGEVYSALQTRVVDGQENPLSLISASKFYEVQKYISMTNHVWDGQWICCNARTWRGLPKDVQDVVARNLDGSAAKQREDIEKANRDTRAELEKRGMAINDTTPESFRNKLRSAGFYKEWRGKLGEEAYGLLEKSVGPLG